jgi:hypothetical protein
MILSRAKHIIASQVERIGSSYTSGSNTFKAVIAKSQVSYDKPSHEYTLLAAHDADISDGKIITGQDEHFIPTKMEKPNTSGGEAQYTRGYLQQANASGDIKSFIDPANASKDVWGKPTGVEGTNWGWVIQKKGIYACFERKGMNPKNTDAIGQIEEAEYLVVVSWADVNASFIPIAECRFTDRHDNDWKVLDIDNKTYINQAYIMRVVTDDR